MTIQPGTRMHLTGGCTLVALSHPFKAFVWSRNQSAFFLHPCGAVRVHVILERCYRRYEAGTLTEEQEALALRIHNRSTARKLRKHEYLQSVSFVPEDQRRLHNIEMDSWRWVG